MALTMDREAIAAASKRRVLGRDAIAVAVIFVLAAAGYLLFPENLALLTRLIAIALWSCRSIW